MSFIILPIVIVYFELANAFMSHINMNIAGSVLCAVAFGLILDIFCFILKKNKWLVFGLTEILAFFFCIEYFTNANYFVFMSPMDIIKGAGGVATEFGDAVVDVILGGLLNILIFHVPTIFILVLNIRGDKCTIKSDDRSLAVLLIAIVFFQSMGTEAEMNYNRELYTYAYSYDNAVKNLGVVTAARLDFLYSYTGVPDAPVVRAADPEPLDSEPEEIVYAYNVEDTDLDSLKESTSSEVYKKMLDYINAQPASRQNEYTGLFKGKNLILIAAESFSSELIREDINPTLYRMAAKGIVVEDFYQPFWGGSTSTGEASILLGRVPTDGVNTLMDVSKHNNSFTMANELHSLGYYTAAMHSGHYDYYNRNITHPALGFDDWVARETGMNIPATWPGDDLAAIDFSFDLYKDYEPYFIYYMSYSGHGLYNFTGNQMSIRYKDYIDSLNLEYSDTVKAYFAANYCFELSLESLIDQLEEAGQLEDTVIVIAADHYPYALQKGDAWKNQEDYLSELYGYAYSNDMTRDHSSLIIWSPCLEELDEPVIAKGPNYSVDILPTLLNLFGIEYDSRLFVGRDILSDSEPLALWINGSWKSEKGYFDAPSQKFTPAEGQSVSDEYISTMKAKVSGKIDFSRKLTGNDFYGFIESAPIP